jgi:hypothetical protein
MANKYKNIIGTGLTDYVQKQINYRKEVTRGDIATNRRSSKELQWLTNRNAWFRLSSGAKFNPSPTEDINYNFEYPTNSQGQRLEGPANLQVDTTKFDAGFSEDLAKKYILQGGTLKNGKRRTTFKDTYPKGNYDSDNNFLGTESSIKGIKDDLGYKPLPGITNVSVGTRGKWRTTLEADVDFVCYNLEQLEIMNKLYMSLGVHVFLEWGHTPYINSSGNIEESFNPIDFFDNRFKDKKILIQEIEKNKKLHHGNYGALLGRVFNFTYSSNPDGSYNCKAQIIGPGAILESIRVNRATMYDFDLSNKEDNSNKYDSDLANVLTSIKTLLFNSRIAIAEESSVTSGNAGNPQAVSRTIINGFGRLDANKYFKGTNPVESVKPTEYGRLLKRIYGSCTYKGYDFSRNNGPATLNFVNGPESFAAYGNAWQYVSNLSTDIKPLDINLFDGFATQFTKGGSSTQKSLGGTTAFSTEEEIVSYQYIKFGHLLALIQHVCIFSEAREGSVTINNNASSTTDYSPVVYIDFHPDNTIMKTGVLEATSDPSVCMVPLKINTKSNESENEAFDKFFTPLDTRKKSRYSWQDDSSEFKDNESKNLIVNKDTLNKINPVLDPLDNKLMNVLVNLQFAIDTLKSLENQNREVDLLSYINAILDGINLSLGKVNNFRAFFDDCSNVVRIIDEHKTENFEKELLTIPNFGLDSITYDYSFSSNIDPKIAAKIVIAAQGQNGGIKDFSEDVLTYQRLNIDIRDRFAPQIKPALPPSKTNQIQNKQEQEKVAQKLFDHLYRIYSLDELVDPSTMNNLLKTFNDTSNIQQKYYKDKNSTLLIPLDISLKIDGITGILPYNAFLLPENRLPLRYQNSNVAFIIFSIDHEFESNQWNTILKGQLIYRNGVNINDDRPKRGGIDLPPTNITSNIEAPNDIFYGGRQTPLFQTGDFNQPEPKAEKLPTDTTSEDITNTTTPDGRRSVTITSTTRDDTPAIIPTDIQTAIPFIKTQESKTGAQIKAYKDIDYTVAAGYKWRIGWGSDTITTPGGSTRAVKEGDVITQSQADADLERRLKTEFKPKVISTCRANGVDYDSLPSPVKTVFIDCAYNYGSLWNDIVISYRDGGNTIQEKTQGLIQELQRRIDRGASQVPKRRGAEIEHLGGTPRY